MANKYLVTDIQLENIANAIRNKSKETEKMGIEDMPDKIAKLTGEMLIKPDSYPDYVRKETLRVANLARTKIKENSLVSICMSDSHYPDTDATKAGYLHALMAIKSLAYLLPVNFIAHLGDVGFEGQTSGDNPVQDVTTLETNLKEILPIIQETQQETIPIFVAIGNHDAGVYVTNTDSTDLIPAEWMYNNFTALSGPEAIYGDDISGGGYCYRDFEKQKIRVYLLNTSENIVKNGQDGIMTITQQQWIAQQLLDFNNEKGSDAINWGFLILCHYPLDYGGTKPVSNIFNAYTKGETITVNKVTYDFNGKNNAKFISQFHGHIHNFLTDQLYFGDVQTRINGTPQTAENQYEAYRIAIPNAEYNRENYYYGDTVTEEQSDGTTKIIEWSTDGTLWGIKLFEGEYGYSSATVDEDGNPPILNDNRISYHKTPETAQDVSFVVNVINPSESMLYSFTYGAGPQQRTIGYDFNRIKYNVSFNSTDNSVISSNIDTIVYGGENSKYETTLTPIEGYQLVKDTISIKMNNIELKDVDGVLDLTTGKISISPVDGDIEISATTNLASYYTVDYDLANVNKSLTAVDRVENVETPTYSATFVAKESDNSDPYYINPYLLKITMGGIDITGSSYVKNDINNYTININPVTGPIKISVKAYKSNLWMFAEEYDNSNIYNDGYGYANDTRLSSPDPTTTAQIGYVTTGFIPYQVYSKQTPPTIEIIGADVDINESALDVCRAHVTNPTNKKTRRWINITDDTSLSFSEAFTITADTNTQHYIMVPKINSNGHWVVLNTSDAEGTLESSYIRFALPCTAGENLIIHAGEGTEIPVTLYNITYNLNGLTASNLASTIKENTSYTTEIKDKDNYTLNGTPIIIMGGTDITNTVLQSDGRTIIIEKVTGDIVITAESEIVAGPSYNNLIDEAISAPGATDIYNEIGYKKGVRLSTSANGEEVTDSADMYTTGYIDCSNAEKIYIKNIGIASTPKTPYCFFYNSTGQVVSGTYITLSNLTSDSNGVITIDKPNSSTIKYLRICSNQIDETSIITINEYIDN